MASGSNKFLFQFPYTPVLRIFPHPHPTQSLSSAQQSKLCLVSGQFKNGCAVRMDETDEGRSAIKERQLWNGDGLQSSRYSQSASLLAYNRIAASQLIRSGLHHSWYKQVPTHCLLLRAIEAGDLLDSVKYAWHHSIFPSAVQHYFRWNSEGIWNFFQ